MSAIGNVISLLWIGIIIWLIISFHGIVSEILHDIENLGHSAFQALGSFMEKMTCCTTGCPGENTKCNASEVKDVEKQGYNICSNCSPPCKLPSFDNGMSCGGLLALGLGILLLIPVLTKA